MSKINVIFKTDGDQVKTTTLSTNFDLSEFKSAATTLFGSIENFRFLVKGKQLNIDDASKFKEQHNLFHDNCVVQLVKCMKGGYPPLHELVARIHREIPNTFKANTTNTRVQCVACMDTNECMKFNCPSCSHAHVLCTECSIQYFTINELEMKCFSCSKRVDYHAVFKNSPNFIAMLDELQEMYETVKNIDCQICNCGELQINETLYSKQYCNSCKRWYCFFCNNTWNDAHMQNAQYTCHNNCVYENAITFDMVQLGLRCDSSWTEVPNRRTCPKCRTLGSYGNACQMHTCHQCKHQFCFICLRDESVCNYGKDKKCTLASQSYGIFPKSCS